MSNPPRYAPDIPFPARHHVPGQPAGPEVETAGRSANAVFLYGVDLFNAGYYWEAHEQWEALWLAAGRIGPTADSLKALIKLAAAGVKHRQGAPRGVRAHACRATELLEGAAAGEPRKVDRLLELAAAICRDGWPNEPPVLTPILGVREAASD